MLAPAKHTLETIWGHDAARRVVPRLLSRGRLPHAILLTGPDGVGKRSLAFAMAKAILSAGRPLPPATLTAPRSAGARRKLDEEPGDDLFGGGGGDDLFGDSPDPDLFPTPAEEPATPPPAPPSVAEAAPAPAEEPVPAKPKKKATPRKKPAAEAEPPAQPPAVSAAPATAPVLPPPPPLVAASIDTPRQPPFAGYDPRTCRLVEASYPVSWDKDGRPEPAGHVDLTIIEPMGGRRGIVVDQARYLQDISNLAPVEGYFRVVLVFGADSITQEGGNCILKLLEEPPSYLVLILVADRLSSVLPTIRSRCTLLPLSPLPRDLLVEKLVEEEKLEHRLAQVAAALSEGRPGVALAAVEKGLLQRRRTAFEARLQLDRFGIPALASAAERLAGNGNLNETLWLLTSFCRDRLVRNVAPDHPELLVHGDEEGLLDVARPDLFALDDEADRLVASYRLLGHPFLPNSRAALELVLWPETD